MANDTHTQQQQTQEEHLPIVPYGTRVTRYGSEWRTAGALGTVVEGRCDSEVAVKWDDCEGLGYYAVWPSDYVKVVDDGEVQ